MTDDVVRSPSGVLVPASIDPFHRVLHHVAPSGLVGGTAKTSGMRRVEAIRGSGPSSGSPVGPPSCGRA